MNDLSPRTIALGDEVADCKVVASPAGLDPC